MSYFVVVGGVSFLISISAFVGTPVSLLLETQNVKTSIIVFCRECER